MTRKKDPFTLIGTGGRTAESECSRDHAHHPDRASLCREGAITARTRISEAFLGASYRPGRAPGERRKRRR